MSGPARWIAALLLAAGGALFLVGCHAEAAAQAWALTNAFLEKHLKQ